jgi:hypothetical protein
MLDVLIVTLAVGPKYVESGANLMHVLDRLGNATLVVTDDPRPFPARTIIIPYTSEAAHIWHSKRHALRAGLERARTVYFVDADYQLQAGWNEVIPTLKPLPPGASSWWPKQTLGTIVFRNIGPLADAQRFACPELLDRIATCLGTSPWQPIPWWGDDLYAVARDDRDEWQQFLAAWDRFVVCVAAERDDSSAHRMFLTGDGIATAFAVAAVGWKPWNLPDAFTPIKRAFYHVHVGTHYALALEEAIRFRAGS